MSSLLLELKNISKTFNEESGAAHSVLNDVNIQIELPGEKGFIVSIISSIGAGKSTLLKIISGIENQSSGSKFLIGNEYHKSDGSIVYIPENPSSFPWMSVRENVLFGLRNRGNSFDEKEVKKIINDVELTGYEDHYPDDKSLGFRFRMSLARALAIQPKIILLDDPFKRMSSDTKGEIYSLLLHIRNNYRTVFILATTNLIEAIVLSKMLFLMDKDIGTIFDKIEHELGNSTFYSPLKDQKFIELLNRVELKLRKKNITDTITHSV